jgi:hypothetical protein
VTKLLNVLASLPQPYSLVVSDGLPSLIQYTPRRNDHLDYHLGQRYWFKGLVGVEAVFRGYAVVFVLCFFFFQYIISMSKFTKRLNAK